MEGRALMGSTNTAACAGTIPMDHTASCRTHPVINTPAGTVVDVVVWMWRTLTARALRDLEELLVKSTSMTVWTTNVRKGLLVMTRYSLLYYVVNGLKKQQTGFERELT